MGAGSLCDVMTLRSSIVSHGAFAAVLLRVEQGQRSANDAFGSNPAQEPKDRAHGFSLGVLSAFWTAVKHRQCRFGRGVSGGKDDGGVCARGSDKERWSICDLGKTAMN